MKNINKNSKLFIITQKMIKNNDVCYYDNWAGLTDDSIKNIKNFYNNKCEIMCGASRYTIIFKNNNYVIKINYPFYKEDEEDKKEHLFSINYNLSEIKLRQNIIKKYPKLNRIFLPLYNINKDICFQEKIIDFNKSNYLFEKKDILKDYKFLTFCSSLKKNNKIKNNKLSFNYLCDKIFDDSNAAWWYYVYYYYGKEITKQLYEAKKYFQIDDIHDNNIGFTKKKEPVIFDYIGFYD